MKKNTILKTLTVGALGAFLFTGCAKNTQYLGMSNQNPNAKQALNLSSTHFT